MENRGLAHARRHSRKMERHKESPETWGMVGKGLFGWMVGDRSEGSKNMLERDCGKPSMSRRRIPTLSHKHRRDAEGLLFLCCCYLFACLFVSRKMRLIAWSIWESSLHSIKEIKAGRLRFITAEDSDKLM